MIKELGISPSEINNMTSIMVKDLLTIHFAVKEVESEELDKFKTKAKL
tara:strand:+ start:277 stop:420 length:144 start_codon:yes stop_codon:yes gene_type:complete